jgi:hypothetical protein
MKPEEPIMAQQHVMAAAFAACMAWASLGSPSTASAQFYVEVEAGPPHVEDSPSTYYEGRPVYYYDGRWYYRRGPRWAYYRDEPRPLVVYRSSPEWRHHRHEDRYDRRPPQRPHHEHHEHHEHHHRP